VTETELRVQFTAPPDRAAQRRMISTINVRSFRRFRWLAIGLAAAAFLYTVLMLAVLRKFPVCEVAVVAALAVWSATYPWRCASRILGSFTTYFANPVYFEITEEEAGETSAVGRTTIRWAAVTSVTETAEFWVLRADRVSRVTLPRRHLAATDEATIRRFMVGRGLVPEQTPEG